MSQHESSRVNAYANFGAMNMSNRTPNQTVAYNLAAARSLRGWTQEEAAERLAPHIGSHWSKATFSAAERSIAGGRVRQFTADDLYAFAKAFNLPVLWFLLPPEEAEAREGAEVSESLDLLFGLDWEFIRRLSRLLASVSSFGDVVVEPGELSVNAVRYATRHVVEAALESELGKVERAGDVVQEIADGLGRAAARREEISTEVLRRLKET